MEIHPKDQKEAVKLTKDYLEWSHHPMWFSGRVYFITDRDGMMNIWSMSESGEDLKQHTNHKEFDVRSASISNEILFIKSLQIYGILI